MTTPKYLLDEEEAAEWLYNFFRNDPAPAYGIALYPYEWKDVQPTCREWWIDLVREVRKCYQ